MAKRKATKRKSKKKWIQGAIKRPGALTAYAKGRGGLTKAGTISKSWCRRELARLKKKKRTKADTQHMRQINLFLKQLAK